MPPVERSWVRKCMESKNRLKESQSSWSLFLSSVMSWLGDKQYRVCMSVWDTAAEIRDKEVS